MKWNSNQTAQTRRPALWGLVLMTAAFPMMTACIDVPRGSEDKNDLASMKTTTIDIPGKATYTAYIADDFDLQRVGLMNTTESELPTDRGMIFVFDGDGLRSFWMRNTIIPLDIAYIRSDGTIVKTYTMEALNEMGYPSIEPARFVLEVRAGQFEEHGIAEGDQVTIPAELFGD